MKIYKSTLKKLIKECINEVLEGGNDEGPFAVYQKGGSIGGDKSNYIPRLGGVVNYLFDDVEKAKEVAKKRRKHLSRGEKSYYGMGYGVAKLKPEEIAKLDKSRLHEDINEVLEGGPGSGPNSGRARRADVTGKDSLSSYSDPEKIANISDIEKNMDHLTQRIKQTRYGDPTYSKELQKRLNVLKQELKKRGAPQT